MKLTDLENQYQDFCKWRHEIVDTLRNLGTGVRIDGKSMSPLQKDSFPVKLDRREDYDESDNVGC
jgi:hypothetical protein